MVAERMLAAQLVLKTSGIMIVLDEVQGCLQGADASDGRDHPAA